MQKEESFQQYVLCQLMVSKLVRGGVDGDAFLDFVENELMPTLMPFDGYNPRSVVIMDNCSNHHLNFVCVH